MANEIDFMSAMRREHTQLESSLNNNNEDSRPKTKNEIIRLKKEVPKLLLRFLPSTSKLNGEPNASLAVTQRGIMFNANTGSKKFTASLTLPSVVDFNNPVEAKVAQWTQAGNAKLFSTFNGKDQPSKIRNTHWLNVLQVVAAQDGTMQYVMDSDGTPKVFALSVPDSGYNAILTQITDPMNTIDGQPIIGFGRSMPTMLAKPDQTTFSANVYGQPNLALGPIDQNAIIPKLDDFAMITESSDKSQPDFFKNIIGYVEGTSAQDNNIVDPVNNFATPVVPQQNSVPDPFNMQQPQQPASQQQLTVSPKSMLATDTGSTGVNPWAVTQQPQQQQVTQQPQQQVTPTQPAQQPQADVSTTEAFAQPVQQPQPQQTPGISPAQAQDLNSFLDNL